MTPRKTVVLTGSPVRRLPQHLVLAEQIERYDEIGDCPACAGTGTAIIYMCLAGNAHMHVKDCGYCSGTGWADRVERTLRTPSVRRHTVPVH